MAAIAINFNTPRTIITDAFFESGITQEGQEPNGEQIARGMRRLTNLINVLQTSGLKLWLYSDTAITLSAGVNPYTMGPGGSVNMVKPMRGIQAYFLSSTLIRTPLTTMSWSDYLLLSSVANSNGAINSYFIDKQQTQLIVWFYNTPDATAATGTAHILIQQQVTNFTGLTDTMNFPIEWNNVLVWGLADELAGRQPIAVQQRCAQKAQYYRTILEDWDVEDASTMFAPDSRADAGGSRFL